MSKEHGLRQMEEAEIDALVAEIEAEKAAADAAKKGPPKDKPHCKETELIFMLVILIFITIISESEVLTRTDSSLHFPIRFLDFPIVYAVLGAGFAGLSVVYHLLKVTLSRGDSHVRVDIYDEVGLRGGVSGGLIHPYSPKECWIECLELLRVAEEASALDELKKRRSEKTDGFRNARDCLPSCRIQSINQDASKNLIPNLSTPCDAAFYRPDAVNINPQRYIQALFLACQNLVQEAADLGQGEKELHLHKSSISELIDLESEYIAVIVCLGAKADLLSELSGRLPLRTCRGVIAHMQLPELSANSNIGNSPSILSDAWLAVQNSSNLYMGATWDWKSRNYSRDVSNEEASSVLQELLPKASVIYPHIKDWEFSGAMAGVRAMPPLITNNGSLPLLGSIDEFVTGNGNHCAKFWLFGGLGSRGLLYCFCWEN
ncbi:unnamed protein product [Rhodiola kirilowii]